MWKVTTKSPTSPFAPIPAQPTDLKKVEVAAAKKGSLDLLPARS